MLKILWVVNTIFPYPAEKLNVEKTVFGGWLNSLGKILESQENIELAIATTYSGKDLKLICDKKTRYYLIPTSKIMQYNKKIEKYCKEIIDEFEPDILHIHGTEYSHGLSFLNVCEGKKIKKLVSIQGLTTCIHDVYLAGISHGNIIKNITLRDAIKCDTLFAQKRKFKKRSKYESDIINKCEYAIGRTDWDYYNSRALNCKIKYFHLPETVRESFYSNIWNLQNIEKNSIYLSQASYPIKGLHVLLRAINILKTDFPNVKLYISGLNITQTDSIKSKLKLTGYGKYIKDLIKKYDLRDNVVFTGKLEECKVVERLLKTHVVVVPSVVENESNSLTEAHLLGIPTVAAFSGGMTDRIVHKKTGFLYPFSDAAMCAGYIMEYFNNDKIAIEYGEAARKEALKRNNPEVNRNRIVDIYNEILGD